MNTIKFKNQQNFLSRFIHKINLKSGIVIWLIGMICSLIVMKLSNFNDDNFSITCNVLTNNLYVKIMFYLLQSILDILLIAAIVNVFAVLFKYKSSYRKMVISCLYDNLGRVTKRILPLGQEESFTYDAAGNVLTHTDFNGNTITCEYDKNNRLKKKIFPDLTEENYGYTETGRPDTVVDARGTTISLYDLGNRLTKVIHPDGSAIEYQYDTMGNKTALIIENDTTRYSYDQLNRLKTVTDPDGGLTTYAYDEVGNRQSITYPNSTKAEYTYDELNRLKKLFNHKSNGDTISCYEYSLGPAGNRTQVLEHTGRLVQYTYDDTYKLTEEKINDPNFGLRIISYEYDPVGNRLMKIDNGDTTQYVYDDNDRFLTENLELETRNYVYDANGNTLKKIEGLDTTSYSYDYQNRLKKVLTNADTIAYAYDTDGIRMQKVVNGDVTNYLVDKNRDYAQVLEERDGIGTVLVKYNYGDDLISQKRSSLTSYFHYDGQMSTRQLSDDSQQVTDTYTYDAFGLLLNRSGATENKYMYTGEQYDPNVGFYYLRARYMNPETGRFLTMDTWPGSMFEPLSLHKYLYCGNDPVDYVDWSGEFLIVDLVKRIQIQGILSQKALIKFLVVRAIKKALLGAAFGGGE